MLMGLNFSSCGHKIMLLLSIVLNSSKKQDSGKYVQQKRVRIRTSNQRVHSRPSHKALEKSRSSKFIPGTAKDGEALELEPEPELDVGG
jgi:hypothetical protein